MGTPYHGYELPQKGATDWHIPLNNNFKKLDKKIEIRDLDQNRTNYSPLAGAKFEATDSGSIYYGTGSSWELADRHVRSLNYESSSHGETIIPAPDADLVQFIQDYQGWVIDLAGRTYQLSQTLVLPNGTYIKNGKIVDDGSDTSNFSRRDANNGLLIDTPPGDDREDITLENVQFGPRNLAIEGVRIHQPKRLWLKQCYFRGLRWGDALRLVGKNTTNNERGTALIDGCRFEDAPVTVGEQGVRGPRAIDYVTFQGCSFENRSKIELHGENLALESCRNNATAGDAAVVVTGHKCQIENLQTHHAAPGVHAIDCERLTIDGVHAMAMGDHAVLLEDVQNSEISRVHNGRANVSAIRLQSTDRDCTNNHVYDCVGETYEPSDGTMTPIAIEEANAGAYGNKFTSNRAGNAQTPWDLNSGDVEANTPRVSWDAAPVSVEEHRVILASSRWDPNSTGGASLVTTTDDGSSWVTVADL